MEPILLDFGEPGVNVQEGYQKLGLKDQVNVRDGTFESQFPCNSKECTISIQGYTFRRGDYPEIPEGPYKTLSNLLRSSFFRTAQGVMKVEVVGLKPWSSLRVKTYHHTTYKNKINWGGKFTLKYEGLYFISI